MRSNGFKYFLSVVCLCFICLQKTHKHLLFWETGTDFPGGPVVKNPLCSAGDVSSIPGWGPKNPHAVELLSPRTRTTESVCYNEDPMQSNEWMNEWIQKHRPHPRFGIWERRPRNLSIYKLSKWLLCMLKFDQQHLRADFQSGVHETPVSSIFLGDLQGPSHFHNIQNVCLMHW